MYDSWESRLHGTLWVGDVFGGGIGGFLDVSGESM